MKAVILAAGKGKRMRPLTDSAPKPLIKVGGVPIIEHIFRALPKSISEVFVVIGYKGGMIKKYLGGKFRGKKVSYIFQKNLGGTAEAVLLTKAYFKKGERFLIIYGDELPTGAEVAKGLSYRFSWLCREASNAWQSGVPRIAKDGRILAVREKPLRSSSRVVVGGFMVVNSDIFTYRARAHRDKEFYLTYLLNQFVKDHKVYAVWGRKDLFFSTPEDIIRFNKKLLH